MNTRCPSCGSEDLVVTGQANQSGYVRVLCNNCGNAWEQRIPDK